MLVLLLLAYIVASMVLAGGQLGPTKPPIYDAVLDWPVFQVPGWLVAAAAVVSSLCALVVVVTATDDEQQRVGMLMRLVGAGSIIVPWSFALAWPDHAGVVPYPSDESEVGWTLGASWFAAPVGLVPFIVAAVRFRRIQRRRWKR